MGVGEAQGSEDGGGSRGAPGDGARGLDPAEGELDEAHGAEHLKRFGGGQVEPGGFELFLEHPVKQKGQRRDEDVGLDARAGRVRQQRRAVLERLDCPSSTMSGAYCLTAPAVSSSRLDGASPVGATVVDGDHLIGLVGLDKHAFKRCHDEGGLIVGGHDDADQRPCQD